MKNLSFSIIHKGWVALILSVLGIGSLAFSQLEFSDENIPSTVEEVVSGISDISRNLEDRIESLRSGLENPDFLSEYSQNEDDVGSNVNLLKVEWQKSTEGIQESVESTAEKVSQAKFIFKDLSDSFAGRMNDALPSLVTVYKNLLRSQSEVKASENLLAIANEDFSKNIGQPVLSAGKPTIASNASPRSRIAEVINANRAIDLPPANPNLSPETLRLRQELAKAKENVNNLGTNLLQSELVVDDLKKDQKLLSSTLGSGKNGSDMVRSEIERLRKDLDSSRTELFTTKQKMVDEQGKSAALIKNITNELERSRNELANTRDIVANAENDSKKLDEIEQDLKSMQDYLAEASDPEKSQVTPDSLKKLSESVDGILSDLSVIRYPQNPATTSSSNINPEVGNGSQRDLVNKLLVDLSKAKNEVLGARTQNRDQRKVLNERIASLEDELESTNVELIRAVREFEDLKLQVARREFDFANTIKQLEEEAQVAQNALGDASIGKLPAIPFIEEMESNLAESEERVQSLSRKFDLEKEKAAEVISALQVELENATIRQKRAMDQLGRRELELKGKNQELNQLEDDKKLLEEELEVVKVLSGQLQDLNSVLEDTKKAQNLNAVSTDQVVMSLRDELNQAKVELTYEKEEKERLLNQSTLQRKSLEGQLQVLRDKLLEEQENLSLQSIESKDLILDLKSELDQAREEIARMKSTGITESVETQQAVAQLQEALGTIRILKETIEETEKANVELDNLRTEVADSMSRQISQMKINEEDRKRLTDKIADLEAEILIYRNKDEADGLQTRNLVADLTQKLNISNEELSNLQKKFENSEDTGITNTILLQEELAEEESRNQELRQRIDELEKQNVTLRGNINSSEQGVASEVALSRQLEERLLQAINELTELKNVEANGNKKPQADDTFSEDMIQDLEGSLAAAEKTIVSLEQELSLREQDKQKLNEAELNLSESMIQDLEESLANAENTISDLEGELASVKNQLTANTKVEKNPSEAAANDLLKLEQELMEAQLQVELLQNKNKQEEDNRLKLEERLEQALASSKGLSPALDQNQSELLDIIEDFKIQLKQKDESIAEIEAKLAKSVTELVEKEAELELVNSMSENLIDSNQSKIIQELKDELGSLQNDLALAQSSVSPPKPSESKDDLQGDLEEAVAETLMLQAELEETKKRLAAFELSQNPNSEAIAEYLAIIEKAQKNENQAIEQIDNLTEALKNSEELRKELEGLLDDLENVEGEQQPDLANSPKVLELQQELLLLQEGLRAARSFEDPEVTRLQNELNESQKETESLRDDFKSAMKDFVRIKNEVELIEQENQRLRNEGLARANTDADRRIIDLRNQVAGLADQNSLLKVDLEGRDRRLADMREQLIQSQSRPIVSSMTAPDNSQLRSQVIRLEGSLQAARDDQIRAQRDADRLKLELDQARQREASLESSLRNAVSNVRTIPQPMPMPSTVNINPGLSNAQIVELENLRQQNNRLQNQLASASSNADRDIFEQRIRELNQKNLTAQVQLDQERKRARDLEKDLEEARDIKRGIIEKGESASLKAELLSDELANAQNRISALEKALIAAREAIRILRNGGNDSSMVSVSMQNPTLSTNQNSLRRPFTSNPGVSSNSFSRTNPSARSGLSGFNPISSPSVTQVPTGNGALNLKVEVQFLNNRNRPSSFTEFFLVQKDFNEILEDSRIRIPVNQGVQSYGELWARSVQRGYRFPGVAANIRNALATTSLMRLKTNSVGEAKLKNIKPGNYYLIGASTLGQVGVVWSKPVQIRGGANDVSLGLSDAIWAE